MLSQIADRSRTAEVATKRQNGAQKVFAALCASLCFFVANGFAAGYNPGSVQVGLFQTLFKRRSHCSRRREEADSRLSHASFSPSLRRGLPFPLLRSGATIRFRLTLLRVCLKKWVPRLSFSALASVLLLGNIG